jgi:hypothetical protein
VADDGTVSHYTESSGYATLVTTTSTIDEPSRFFSGSYYRKKNNYDMVVESDPETDICYLYVYEFIISGGGEWLKGKLSLGEKPDCSMVHDGSTYLILKYFYY